MREFINVVKGAYVPSKEIVSEAIVSTIHPDHLGIGRPVAEEIEDVVEAEELTEFDAAPAAAAPDADADAGDDRLKGTLDPRALAKLLPEVDDLNRFINAVRKVQRGDIATLNMLENRQLAKAFVSLLRDDTQMTQKVFQKLRMVHSDGDEGMGEV